MEYFDVYNEFGSKLNKTIKRGTLLPKGEYHKVVHIWIKNSQGKYLVQQRNKSTDTTPYQWAPTAGAVVSGEEPIKAAIRETYEEIGLTLSTGDLKHVDSLYIEAVDTNYIIEVYKVYKDINLQSLTLDFNEVKAVKYMSVKEIIDRLNNQTFWDFYEFKPKYDYISILEKSHL